MSLRAKRGNLLLDQWHDSREMRRRRTLADNWPLTTSYRLDSICLSGGSALQYGCGFAGYCALRDAEEAMVEALRPAICRFKTRPVPSVKACLTLFCSPRRLVSKLDQNLGCFEDTVMDNVEQEQDVDCRREQT